MNNLLTASEVAKMLRVDGGTVRRWAKHGILAAIKLPPHAENYITWRIRREALNSILGEEQQTS